MTSNLIDKLRIKELEESLANSTTFLAFIGAGDLAVEMICAARGELATRRAAFDRKAFRDQAQATLSSHVETLQAEVLAAPDRIKALPDKAQEWPAMAQEWPARAQELPAKAQEWPAKGQSLFADLVSTAFATYGDLAGRGKTRVAQVRHEEPSANGAGADTAADFDSDTGADTAVKPVSRPAASTKAAAKKTAVKKASQPATPASEGDDKPASDAE